MSARETSQKRKQWKNNTKVYRVKRVTLQTSLQKIVEETPPPRPAPPLQHRAENLSALNRRRMRKRRTILYAKIKSLENKGRQRGQSPGPTTSKDTAIAPNAGVVQASVLVEPDKDKEEEEKALMCSPILNNPSPDGSYNQEQDKTVRGMRYVK
ncbi:unnamed protein product [Acanthoscelides obtectus]|uniref:Uncharacterized protein n=1 Tax=Acanthoscelides obtectus TaxID=200917 RepID=A0A9P0QGP2_ACAOB|nr:unnamed protein product [Acanthoscelides obtectus]CAK1689521.1 hypothetical protein AOBTE_LOCUS37323 [Acanthoscelides obtectus]